MLDFKRKIILFVVIMTMSAEVAFAQDIPASADPLRLNHPQQSIPFSVLPTTKTQSPSTKTIDIPEEYKTITFNLKDVQLEGVSVYKIKTLQPYYENMIDKNVSLADIIILTEEITKHYKQDGYIFAKVFLPPQEIKNGIIKLRAVEGKITIIDIDSKIKLSPSGKNIIEAMKTDKSFNLKDFERKILLFNDLGGLQTRATFFPLSEEEKKVGHIGLKLEFDPAKKPLRTQISFDNRGSEFTGPGKFTFNTTFTNTPLQDDRLSLELTSSTPSKEMKNIRIGYERTLPWKNFKIGFDAALTRTKPGENLALLDLESTAVTNRIFIHYPLIRSRSENLFLRGTTEFDYSRSDILSEPFYKDTLRIFRFIIDWQKADNFQGFTAARTTYSQGLDFLGGSQTGDLNLSRENGHTDFSKLEFSISRQQYLIPNWSLTASIGGQYSPKPLLSAEEFGIGGSFIGRAYDPSEITGDSGIYGSIDVHYSGLQSKNQNWMPKLGAFYDIGRVKNWEEGNNSSESAASAGLNAQWIINKQAAIKFEAAKPLTHPSASNNNSKNLRFFFSLNLEF